MASSSTSLDGDTLIEKVSISGATLALIMQAFSSSVGDCDGLLFGHVQRQTTSNLLDEDVGPQIAREEITASVTGHYCSGRVTSFYDATGRIDPKKLAQIMGDRNSRGGDAPIGWFVGRRESSMRPSMRESAVTANLRATPFQPQNATGGIAVIKGDDAKEGYHSGARTAEGGGIAPSSPNLAITPTQTRIVLSRDSGVSTRSLSRREIVGVSGSSALPADSPSSKSLSNSRRGDITTINPLVPASQEGGSSSKLIGVPPSSPCLFLLLSESYASNFTHTIEYRAYQYRSKSSGRCCFEPRTVNLVNIGPAFRGLYNSFAPVAPFPWFLKPSDMEESPEQGMRTNLGNEAVSDDTEARMRGPQEAEQALLDMYSQDFSVDRLQSLVRVEGKGGNVGELEDLYLKMLKKLENLAKQVCESSDAIAEQV